MKRDKKSTRPISKARIMAHKVMRMCADELFTFGELRELIKELEAMVATSEWYVMPRVQEELEAFD